MSTPSDNVLWSLVASMLIAGCAAAADQQPPADLPPGTEMRAKMASLHERMAACLRSERPLADCRTEMMRDCQELMGEQGCPMMGMGEQMMRKPRPEPTDVR